MTANNNTGIMFTPQKRKKATVKSGAAVGKACVFVKLNGFPGSSKGQTQAETETTEGHCGLKFSSGVKGSPIVSLAHRINLLLNRTCDLLT